MKVRIIGILNVLIFCSKFQQVESTKDPINGLRHKTMKTTIESSVCCAGICMLEKVCKIQAHLSFLFFINTIPLHVFFLPRST